MRRSRAAGALLAAAALLSACGGEDEQEAGPSARSGTSTAAATDGTPVVDMNDALQFVPATISVRAGTRVQWRNVGKIAHTVTTTPSKVDDPDLVEVPDGAKDFDSGFIGEKETYRRTFTEPGTYRYVCIPHEGAAMIGTVVVER